MCAIVPTAEPSHSAGPNILNDLPDRGSVPVDEIMHRSIGTCQFFGQSKRDRSNY